MSDDSSRIDDLIMKGIDKVEEKVDKVGSKVETVESDLKDLNSQFRTHEEMFKKHLETDEKMYQEFAKMNNTLRDNTESLIEHMAQTKLVRQEVRLARDMANDLKVAVEKIDGRLQPIEEDRIKKEAVKEFMKERAKKWSIYVGILGTIIGIIYTISQL